MIKGLSKIFLTATVALTAMAFTPAQATEPVKMDNAAKGNFPSEVVDQSIAVLEENVNQEGVSNYVERNIPAYVADDLYGEWSSIFLGPKSIPNHRLPEKFEIDLSGFVFPHDGVITSGFGVRSKTRNHYGVDIRTSNGDAVRAAFSGKVRVATYDKGGYGYYVIVRHHNGLETTYAHLGRNIVKRGQEVKAGDVIGKTGKSGRMTGSVLHFEVRFLGTPFNPQRFFDFNGKRQLTDNFTYTKDMHDVKPRVSQYRSSNV